MLTNTPAKGKNKAKPARGGGQKGKPGMTSTGRTKAVLRAAPLSGFYDAVKLLAMGLPPRVSLSQAAFFILAARADANGSPATYSMLKEELGELGDSIKTTYAIFLDPSEKFPDGLGWLSQEIDPSNRRQKFLHVSEKGWVVINAVLDSVGA